MVAALELYLDVHATRRLRTLWHALEAEGIPTLASLLAERHRPHLSLVAAARLEPEPVAAALADLDLGVGLTLDLDFVGQFVGRVLWLGVTPTAALLEVHRAVHERLAAAGIEVWDHYRPGRWVPHCTVSMRVPNPLLATALRRCLEVLPVRATVTAASVTDHANDIAHTLTA
ncbi:2'-5' RNA ligase family protein [Amorphoplanes digitatis]|uniref:2'-5' RNA ligase n=1 Tax=Actinoplanes digitatis TaxID=1868 RepID=A0A7W7I148_9ACTN|nr:2'-5' RNA ligase family protein [Actinoplanes digitatis]MBB4764356.1 2'-5' RNA ligase [Actinoplanes digitatis]BFE73775.1 2'-5' RNA ligase family protein [Actinoplanes digitatis]GID94158.1 2'-5' RNA ligase [Actinoplanes digitatis]